MNTCTCGAELVEEYVIVDRFIEGYMWVCPEGCEGDGDDADSHPYDY